MDETRTDRLLHEWDGVVSRAVRPIAAPRPTTLRSRSGHGLGVLPLVAAALAIVLGVAWLGGHEDRGIGNPGLSVPPSGPISTPATTPATSELAPSPSEQVSSDPGAACAPDQLAVAITAWDGAAGSRTAALSLRLVGADACTIDRLWRPELVDGSGRIRIEGGVVRDGGTIELRAGETLTTLAQASNDCAPPPTPPVTIAFILGDGSRVVAAPLTPEDGTIPPCNGPGQAGRISMLPWTR